MLKKKLGLFYCNLTFDFIFYFVFYFLFFEEEEQQHNKNYSQVHTFRAFCSKSPRHVTKCFVIHSYNDANLKKNTSNKMKTR